MNCDSVRGSWWHILIVKAFEADLFWCIYWELCIQNNFEFVGEVYTTSGPRVSHTPWGLICPCHMGIGTFCYC